MRKCAQPGYEECLALLLKAKHMHPAPALRTLRESGFLQEYNDLGKPETWTSPDTPLCRVKRSLHGCGLNLGCRTTFGEITICILFEILKTRGHRIQSFFQWDSPGTVMAISVWHGAAPRGPLRRPFILSQNSMIMI